MAVRRCADCGEEYKGRYQRCRPCLKERQAVQKERRLRLKASGMCTSCGRGPSRPGRTLCESCATRQGFNNRTRYEFNRRRGLCTAGCGREALKGMILCAVCRERENAQQRYRAALRRLKGRKHERVG